MKKSKTTHSSSTAFGAGSSCGKEWTAARDKEVKIEEVTKYLRKLQSLGLVTRSDESASARRRYKYLVGVSGSGRERFEQNDGCWRDRVSEGQQARLTL